MQECSSCPSRLGADETRAFFGKDFGPGVDACATFGHVLGKPGLDPSAVQKVHLAFAKECPKYQEPRPDGRPEYPEARVCAPHPEVFVEYRENTLGEVIASPKPPPTEDEQHAVTSCKGCVNFIPEHVVREELGWYLPLCAATGRLLFPKRLMAEPKSCGQARPGTNRDTTEGMALRPEYDDAFSFGNVKVGAAVFGEHEFIEPAEYPTDREVTPDEAADGIRAWRRVFDPTGSGRYVDLPIFRVDYFPEAEQAKIPRTGDDEHPEWYVDHAGLVYDVAVETMELDETPILIGMAGTGKTELFRHLAWLMCLPFDRISCTRSSEIDDLAGKWLFEDGETRWIDGRVSSCWEKPGVLLVDEPNTAPDEVWQFFRPMTDNAKQLVLDAAKGQRKDRHPWRFLGFAINPAWDIKNIGANEISDADGNRLCAIAVGLPLPEVERRILAQRCQADGYELPTETLDKIMAIAEDIRQLADPLDGTLNVSWGLRPQIAVARKTRWHDLVKCYKRALTDRLDPSAAETIIRIVEGYVA